MGNLATSNKNQQTTQNQQVGIQGTGASGAGANTGKGASQAVGGGISLVFNTGNNKISSKDAAGNGGEGKGKNKKNRVGNSPAPAAGGTPVPASGGNSASNQAGGNIAVSIQQTDQGAVQAGADVSLEALKVAQHANDALLQSNTNAVTLAALALQTGEDVAAVAIPTYAANAIVDRPADLSAIDATAASQPSAGSGTPQKGVMILSVIGIGLSLAVLLGNRTRP